VCKRRRAPAGCCAGQQCELQRRHPRSCTHASRSFSTTHHAAFQAPRMPATPPPTPTPALLPSPSYRSNACTSPVCSTTLKSFDSATPEQRDAHANMLNAIDRILLSRARSAAASEAWRKGVRHESHMVTCDESVCHTGMSALQQTKRQQITQSHHSQPNSAMRVGQSNQTTQGAKGRAGRGAFELSLATWNVMRGTTDAHTVSAETGKGGVMRRGNASTCASQQHART